MPQLKIKFNYAYPEIIKEKNKTYYDMTKFCDWLIANIKKRPHISVPLKNGEFAGVEWKDCKYDDKNNLYYFRLKKLRSRNIPAYSYPNSDSRDIKLRKNQYLGEFNLIIFDPSIKRIIIQKNFFGLTLSQISTALTSMRISMQKSINLNSYEEDGSYVKLSLLLDANKSNEIFKNNIFRSYELRLSDINSLEVNDIKENELDSAIKLAEEVSGISINVKVSMSKAPKNKSLNRKKLLEKIRKILKINDPSKASMVVKTKKDEYDTLDKIDVLMPKLESEIKLDNIERATIGVDVVYNNFLEQNYFDKEKNMQEKARRDGA